MENSIDALSAADHPSLLPPAHNQLQLPRQAREKRRETWKQFWIQLVCVEVQYSKHN